ncbi:MAG: hypothetical protein CMH55_07555 [Myxococcales bacterium]|nr:hypothetical protein [Myxococcales bacterium]
MSLQPPCPSREGAGALQGKVKHMGRPGTYGRVQFECLECHRKFRPRRSEWARASGLSCPDCGSRFWIESKEAQKAKKLGRQAGKLDQVGEATRGAAQQERHPG